VRSDSRAFPIRPPSPPRCPGYESGAIYGVFAPAKTSHTIVNRLNKQIVRVLNTAEVKEKIFNAASEVVASLPEQLGTTMKSEMVRMGKVIKDAGIRID
jgi:tripartite-type tricarboxylate transporter receptor subunit TctC